MSTIPERFAPVNARSVLEQGHVEVRVPAPSFPRRACPREGVGREPRGRPGTRGWEGNVPTPIERALAVSWIPAFAGMTRGTGAYRTRMSRKQGS